MRRKRGLGSEKGAELLEFALVFPLLLLVVLGIIDWGLVFTRYQVLFNAAREGARVSVLHGYADADVQTRVNQYIQGIGLNSGNVTTVIGAAQTVSIGSGCIRVRAVTVSYLHSFLFLGGAKGGIGSYFGGASFGTKLLSARASMRDEMAAAACP